MTASLEVVIYYYLRQGGSIYSRACMHVCMFVILSVNTTA